MVRQWFTSSTVRSGGAIHRATSAFANADNRGQSGQHRLCCPSVSANVPSTTVGLRVDRAHRGCDHVRGSFGDLGEDVAGEMHCAALPGSGEHHRVDRFAKPEVRVGITSCTPLSPRARSARRNAIHNAPSSESPTSTPSTSRSPLRVMPVATITAFDTIRPPARAFTYVASKKTYGNST